MAVDDETTITSPDGHTLACLRYAFQTKTFFCIAPCAAARRRLIEGLTKSPTLEQKLEDLQAERDALLEELADPCASTDPLHPSGRCRCAGEGKCSFCLRMLALERAEAAEGLVARYAGLPQVLLEAIRVVCGKGSPAEPCGECGMPGLGPLRDALAEALGSGFDRFIWGNDGNASKEFTAMFPRAAANPVQPSEPAGAKPHPHSPLPEAEKAKLDGGTHGL